VLVHIERMDKSDLADYARQLPVGPRASVSVVDARRMIVASDRRETVGRRSAGYPDIVYRAAVSGLVAVDRTGVRRVAVYAPVHFGGWVVIVEQDADQFYGGLRSNGQRIELMLLGFIVAAGLAVVVVNSRRHAALAQLAEGARRDTLTGLPNRRVFQERLGEQSRAGLAGAVVFCDLDGFKAINDTYGHDTGDALLVVVAERLRACVRPDDVVSRLGGDEFTVLLTEATRTTEAVAVARRIEAALAEPMSLPGARLPGIGVSCGVAMIGAAGERSLHAADLAMYRAKHSGSGVAVACEVVADVSADALPRAARDR
jgi:diguanylate cyclase (GGDEF)-like protein